ncbi:MAG: hypothetical protein F6K56_44335, partial [Moorea sp. SIO3G5]|nr:hypothetical protein [Moorena sp. SIO3G5]
MLSATVFSTVESLGRSRVSSAFPLACMPLACMPLACSLFPTPYSLLPT